MTPRGYVKLAGDLLEHRIGGVGSEITHNTGLFKAEHGWFQSVLGVGSIAKQLGTLDKDSLLYFENMCDYFEDTGLCVRNTQEADIKFADGFLTLFLYDQRNPWKSLKGDPPKTSYGS
jgi:hypothetical protein